MGVLYDYRNELTEEVWTEVRQNSQIQIIQKEPGRKTRKETNASFDAGTVILCLVVPINKKFIQSTPYKIKNLKKTTPSPSVVPSA